MADGYAVILQACPDEAQAESALVVGRLFGLKAETCQSVVGSTPIVLVDGLSEDQGAVLMLLTNALVKAGAQVAVANQGLDELPRINWPKPPAILRQEIPQLVEDFDLDLPGGSLIQQLRDKLTGRSSGSHASKRQPFAAADLGEITPFSNAALPTVPSDGEPPSGSVPTLNGASEDELLNRMNELFPDEDGIIPNTQEITSMLDRLLPDEDGSQVRNSGPQQTLGSGGHRTLGSGGQQARSSGANQAMGGFSVFLAKISDENRRKKAVPLLVEMAGISEEDAEKLAKKVIIPVLKGVSKEDAESAKHRFAEIGVLARIKGG